MRACQKYKVIYHHNDKYPISLMCRYFEVSRSGYYDWIKKMEKQDKDALIGEMICQCHKETDKTYGYRRVTDWIARKGLKMNRKKVLRIMNKYGMLSEIRRPRPLYVRKQQLMKYDNLLGRDFSADKPNQKWVTDVSYIKTKKGELYLSVIKDLYDNFIVAYDIAEANDNALVFRTLKKAKKVVACEPILHSDQGFQYTSAEYFELTKKYNITISMSRAATPLDNACAENFFGTLKCECIYRHPPADNQEARLLIEEYIDFYNYRRIQLKTKLTPFEFRCQSLTA